MIPRRTHFSKRFLPYYFRQTANGPVPHPSPARRKLLDPRAAQFIRRHRDPKLASRIEAEKERLRDPRNRRWILHIHNQDRPEMAILFREINRFRFDRLKAFLNGLTRGP